MFAIYTPPQIISVNYADCIAIGYSSDRNFAFSEMPTSLSLIPKCFSSFMFFLLFSLLLPLLTIKRLASFSGKVSVSPEMFQVRSFTDNGTIQTRDIQLTARLWEDSSVNSSSVSFSFSKNVSSRM